MTSLVSSEVTIAGEETVAPSVATSPSSLFSTEVSVAEAPAPPTAPEERVETAPEGKPWGFLAVLALLGGLLLMTRKKKEEEERGR
jgi:LPXTG-motif cell wall-anchored protein